MNPLRKAINFLEADKHFRSLSIDLETCGPDALLPIIAARDLRDAAAAVFKRLPRGKRDYLLEQASMGNNLPVWGDAFSGECRRVVEWGNEARAYTVTSREDAYSRRCKYRKTDAIHTIKLCPETFPSIEFLRSDAWRSSGYEGMLIIADHGKDEYTWLVVKAGKLSTQRGWFIYQDRESFHSTKSRDHAINSLEKKIRIKRAEKKASRRERLVARLCKNATATLADAKALGYCDPGIAAFQSRHGIGDTATLPQLMATGDPSAVRLALTLARKI